MLGETPRAVILMESLTMNLSYNPRPKGYAQRYNKTFKNCESSA